MADRLKYETHAGNLAERETYLQLLEYFAKIEEDMRIMSALARLRKDTRRAIAWSSMANNFNRFYSKILALMGRAEKTSMGYDGHG